MKKEGDLKFGEGEIDQALAIYEEALQMDNGNEYLWANISLMHYKKQDYDKCIDYITKALEIIDAFQNDTQSFNKDTRLEVKLLLRRGKSYELTERYEQAKADLDKCILLD